MKMSFSKNLCVWSFNIGELYTSWKQWNGSILVFQCQFDSWFLLLSCIYSNMHGVLVFCTFYNMHAPLSNDHNAQRCTGCLIQQGKTKTGKWMCIWGVFFGVKASGCYPSTIHGLLDIKCTVSQIPDTQWNRYCITNKRKPIWTYFFVVVVFCYAQIDQGPMIITTNTQWFLFIYWTNVWLLVLAI